MPEQNGTAERVTIVERTRWLLFNALLAKTFWAEALHTSDHLMYSSPTQGHDCTSEQIWSGSKPDVFNLRIFDIMIMVQIPKQRRQMIDVVSYENYDDRLYDLQAFHQLECLFHRQKYRELTGWKATSDCGSVRTSSRTTRERVSLQKTENNDNWWNS